MKKLNIKTAPAALVFDYTVQAGKLVNDTAEFAADIKVTGVDSNTGELFLVEFMLTELDPEFQKMVNEYLIRKIAEHNFPGAAA